MRRGHLTEIQFCTRSRSSKPGWQMLTEETELSCSCSPSVLRNSGSISSVRFRSKPLMFRTWVSGGGVKVGGGGAVGDGEGALVHAQHALSVEALKRKLRRRGCG